MSGCLGYSCKHGQATAGDTVRSMWCSGCPPTPSSKLHCSAVKFSSKRQPSQAGCPPALCQHAQRHLPGPWQRRWTHQGTHCAELTATPMLPPYQQYQCNLGLKQLRTITNFPVYCSNCKGCCYILRRKIPLSKRAFSGRYNFFLQLQEKCHMINGNHAI